MAQGGDAITMKNELIRKDIHCTGWSLNLFKNPDPVSIVFEHHSVDEPFLEILPEEIDDYCALLQDCKRFFPNETN
jgi:hypothetical protein